MSFKCGWVPSQGFLLASAAQVYAMGWASPWPNAEDSLSLCYNLHPGLDKAAQPHSLPAESPQAWPQSTPWQRACRNILAVLTKYLGCANGAAFCLSAPLYCLSSAGAALQSPTLLRAWGRHGLRPPPLRSSLGLQPPDCLAPYHNALSQKTEPSGFLFPSLNCLEALETLQFSRHFQKLLC